MLLPRELTSTTCPTKSRKQDTGKQIQHRCMTYESLLPSGSICATFCLRGLNHRQFFLLPHYHFDVDVSRHTQCHLTQISAWLSVELQCFVICYLVVCFSKEIAYMVHMSQVTITYTVLYYWIDIHSKLCDKGCLSTFGKDTGLYLTRKYSWWYFGQ